MKSVFLAADGLLCKWGFGDGDILTNYAMDEPDDTWELVHRHEDELLVHLVTTLLLPVLDEKVELAIINTCHNPIRAKAIDGVDVTSHWYDPGFSWPWRSVEFTKVPWDLVLDTARSIHH